MSELLGWSATAVFTASYFFERPLLLRLFQMGGAALWLTYGVLIGASPVIVANAIVLLAVLLTTVRGQRRERAGSGGEPGRAQVAPASTM